MNQEKSRLQVIESYKVIERQLRAIAKRKKDDEFLRIAGYAKAQREKVEKEVFLDMAFTTEALAGMYVYRPDMRVRIAADAMGNMTLDHIRREIWCQKQIADGHLSVQEACERRDDAIARGKRMAAETGRI